jgi:hypothetical protein
VPERTPTPLDALWADIRALSIAAGLVAWRIERDLVALEEGDSLRLIRLVRLPDPDAAPRLPNRRCLARYMRSAP